MLERGYLLQFIAFHGKSIPGRLVGDWCGVFPGISPVLGDPATGAFARGPFSPNAGQTRRWRDITDGTSNTVLMHKKALFTSPDEFLGNSSGEDADSPRQCGTKFGADYGGRGHHLGNGRLWATGWNLSVYTVTTAMGPNRPSCKYFTNATSRHPGGVCAVRCDGAVRFISDSIDNGNSESPPATPSVPSPYGVWGALGSASGEESIGQF